MAVWVLRVLGVMVVGFVLTALPEISGAVVLVCCGAWLAAAARVPVSA